MQMHDCNDDDLGWTRDVHQAVRKSFETENTNIFSSQCTAQRQLFEPVECTIHRLMKLQPQFLANRPIMAGGAAQFSKCGIEKAELHCRASSSRICITSSLEYAFISPRS